MHFKNHVEGKIMEWTKEAEQALFRVPFFVRKRVRKRVEEEAMGAGSQRVTIAHVRTCQQRFLNRMEDEVRGYQVESCFGPSGCLNRACAYGDIAERIEQEMSSRALKDFLKERVGGPLKMHHEFRVSISDCPNACSRPQIVDLGLIGACIPLVTNTPCSQCGACVEACRERAIELGEDRPVLDEAACLACGQCIRACPTGTLLEGRKGYRVLVGGKLGRHPRLAQELPHVHSVEGAMALVGRCLDHYLAHCLKGERFGEIIERTGLGALTGARERIEKKETP
jgi:anaerobic sulfite reductase subunit C